MKSIAHVFILFLLLATQAQAQAPAPAPESLSDASVLRKLSLSLRGVPPEAADYKALAAIANSSGREAFLKQKANDYIATPGYRDRMVFRLTELFQVNPSPIPEALVAKYANRADAPPGIDFGTKTYTRDAMTDLFARIATQNLSWDSLLTEKSYVAYPKNINVFTSSPGDIGFLNLVATSLPYDDRGGALSQNFDQRPELNLKSYPISFASNDLRVAGALTTSRFMGRYTTTGVNKNRRRAAAVFKIFLCDPMIPAIASNSDRTHEFLDATFASTYEVTENQIKAGAVASAEARHGSDAQCLSCHYKLDPMGHTFQNIGIAINPDPSPGALAFKHTQTGVLENTHLDGIGDLGAAITKQPEYVDCQVKWFWKQFIGQDAPLSATKKQELITKFEAVGRRTNDFVAALVTSDDFRKRPVALSVVTFSQVEPILKRCDACHEKEPSIPTFAKLPIGYTGKWDEHKTWINDINDRLSRPDGARGKMPRDPSVWSQEDVDLVKKWISQGAPDDQGQSTTTGVAP